MNNSITRKLARIAIFSAILYIQELALSFIPNIQLTQCLIAVYFCVFELKETLAIVGIYVILDNLVFGTFNLVYTPVMILGWILLALILFLIRKHKDNKLLVSIVVGLHGFIYSWLYVLATVFVTKTNFIAYLISDLPFELILVANGFITTQLLYIPLTNILNRLMKKTSN